MSPRSDILDGLTEPQRQAVTHVEGPLLVVAGAGSGKTRVITRRVAYLAAQGVPPRKILAVTFTNKAAGEMRERIEQLSGARGAWVSTFHSLCASMLRISADSLGLTPRFSIYDRADQLNTVKEAMGRLEISTSTLRPATVLGKISNAKNQLETPASFAAGAVNYADQLAANVYRVYQEILGHNGALDFDDLLMHVAVSLDGNEEFLQRWQRRFDFLLIDEYQDTNHAQYRIARRLAARHENLCATGDADQAIYGWRGADIRNILTFEKDFPSARVVKLEQNYRSTQVILDAANSLIAQNALRHERGLWTENEPGRPVSFRLGDDADDEAAVVLEAVQERRDEDRPYRDFAVFYRTNAQSRAFEEACFHASVPYRLVGATEFYARQEIKDVLAYLRVCLNERDDLSLVRIINVPTRGIGAKTVERLKAWAEQRGGSLWSAVADAEHATALGPRAKKAVKAFAEVVDNLRATMTGPAADFCSHLLELTGYGDWLKKPENEERLENVGEFLNRAVKYDLDNPEGNLDGFLQEVSLVSDVDNLDGTADAVALMTLHAAKGLEFPVVFLTGLEEGLLPHANAIRPDDAIWGEDDAKVEEERRLCYVGVTRAQKELILTAAEQRVQYNEPSDRAPSRFLAELAADVFDEDSRAALQSALGEHEEYRIEYDWHPRHQRRRRTRATSLRQAGPTVQQTGSAPGAPSPDDQPDDPQDPGGQGAAPAASVADFAVGDRVVHEPLGEGEIVAIEPTGRYTFAVVALRAGGKRMLELASAPLRKL